MTLYQFESGTGVGGGGYICDLYIINNILFVFKKIFSILFLFKDVFLADVCLLFSAIHAIYIYIYIYVQSICSCIVVTSAFALRLVTVDFALASFNIVGYYQNFIFRSNLTNVTIIPLSLLHPLPI